MKAARKLRNLQQPQSLIGYIREFLTPTAWKQARQAVPRGRAVPRWDLQPVVVIMLLAMRGNWGTHYDYVGMPSAFQMALGPRFLWLAFFPQLVFWVGFTILMGTLAGSLAVVLLLRPRIA